MSTDADDLLIFARVVDCGSFSRAAERLGLPKSTVSRRLAALERRLGERLLQRSTRQLSLTAFGQDVLDHARAVATEVDGALALALHRQARPSGRLRVSVPGDFASQALDGLLARFVADHPDITLSLDLSPRRVDLIAEAVDVAIRFGELPADSLLAARQLAVFGVGLYAAPALLARHGVPAHPDALRQMPGLMTAAAGEDASPWPLVRQGAPQERCEVLPEPRHTANSPELLTRLARQGTGVVAVAHFLAEPWQARGELLRVLPDWCLPDTTVWALYPGRRLMPARTRVFIDRLAAALDGPASLIRMPPSDSTPP